MIKLKPFDCFSYDVGTGLHAWTTDTFNVMLTDVAPVAGNTVPSDITEIAAGNGYSSSGQAVTFDSISIPGVPFQWFGTGPTWTAGPGNIATFRYGVLYNVTKTKLIAWFDRTIETTIVNTFSYTVMFNATDGILRFTSC